MIAQLLSARGKDSQDLVASHVGALLAICEECDVLSRYCIETSIMAQQPVPTAVGLLFAASARELCTTIIGLEASAASSFSSSAQPRACERRAYGGAPSKQAHSCHSAADAHIATNAARNHLPELRIAAAQLEAQLTNAQGASSSASVLERASLTAHTAGAALTALLGAGHMWAQQTMNAVSGLIRPWAVRRIEGRNASSTTANRVGATSLGELRQLAVDAKEAEFSCRSAAMRAANAFNVARAAEAAAREAEAIARADPTSSKLAADAATARAAAATAQAHPAIVRAKHLCGGDNDRRLVDHALELKQQTHDAGVSSQRAAKMNYGVGQQQAAQKLEAELSKAKDPMQAIELLRTLLLSQTQIKRKLFEVRNGMGKEHIKPLRSLRKFYQESGVARLTSESFDQTLRSFIVALKRQG